ncbi:hypothetical protein LF1_19190 [Rubripirellula obstinata]|uniref:Uncharacterized protein n=1 Tax=Rubripirellula obstinata TaxID=406547 RepID=A0A5B1CE17_9BACT|nr:hypothetical protein LF1_19190 [Rubripirellula obstinata]
MRAHVTNRMGAAQVFKKSVWWQNFDILQGLNHLVGDLGVVRA